MNISEIEPFYVEVLKRVLVDTVTMEGKYTLYDESLRAKFFDGTLSKSEAEKILSVGVYDSYVKDGYVNPVRAETMIGMPRLSNFQYCIEQAIKNKIQGDIIETGVWRGGACIMAAGVIKSLKSNKKIYVSDSFEGLPKPESKYSADDNDPHHTLEHLKVS